jgi:hypothetical protein
MGQPPKRRHAPRRDEISTTPVNRRYICVGCGADVKHWAADPIDPLRCLNCQFGAPRYQAPPDGSTTV